MIITSLIPKESLPLHTIIHVGAHIGQDIHEYINTGAKQVIFIEADPIIFQHLIRFVSNLGTDISNKTVFINSLIGDSDGSRCKFYRFNNQGMSSSAYRSTDLLREKFIGLQESDAPIELVAQRLDTLIANLNLEINDPSALVIDAQGSELSVLKGAGSVLRLFKYLEVEVSTEPIYEGAPLYQEVDKFLSDNSFSRISEVPWHGDVVYTRMDKPQPIILSQGDLEKIQRIVSEREHYLAMIEEYKEFIKLNGFSKSQIGQDLFALSQNGFKRNGYFVEIGAASGVNLSNTYLLEKKFGWTGILVEPAPVWHEELHRERNSIIDKRCVWSHSGEILNFVSANSPELSTIATFIESDFHKENRQGTTLTVASVSLIDLLAEYDAPHEIEFLSIDTEGSELSILEPFDFDTYKIKCIAVEHNWTAAREKIFNFLTQKGYRRVHHRVSQWDDWYVLP